MESPLVIDIEKATIDNVNYRQIIYTGRLQLVLMSLMPGEDIPLEVHEDVDQFVRVESGQGIVQLDEYDYDEGIYYSNEYQLQDGMSVVIPAGTPHYFKNTHPEDPLKLYSIYTPPEHPRDRLDFSQPLNHDD